jgi:CheY-like chemotaxis protein
LNPHAKPVKIVMIEDDEGHARLIEKNIRRAGVGHEIIPFVYGADALDYLLGDDRSGVASFGRQQLILLDLNLPDMTGIDRHNAVICKYPRELLHDLLSIAA